MLSLTTWYYAWAPKGLVRVSKNVAEALLLAEGSAAHLTAPRDILMRDQRGNEWVHLLGAVVALEGRTPRFLCFVGQESWLATVGDGGPRSLRRTATDVLLTTDIFSQMAREVSERAGAPRDGERPLAAFLAAQGTFEMPLSMADSGMGTDARGLHRAILRDLQSRESAERHVWDLRRATLRISSTCLQDREIGDHPDDLLYRIENPERIDFDRLRGGEPAWDAAALQFAHTYLAMQWDASWGERPSAEELIDEMYAEDEVTVAHAYVSRYHAFQDFVAEHLDTLAAAGLVAWEDSRQRSFHVQPHLYQVLAHCAYEGAAGGRCARFDLPTVIVAARSLGRLENGTATAA